MKQHTENYNNLMDWENMSTQMLNDLLSQDFAADQDNVLNPEIIVDILDELERRENNALSKEEIQAAWTECKTQFITEDSHYTETPDAHLTSISNSKSKNRKSPAKRKLRWALAAAIAVCLLIMPAMGRSGTSSMVHWTEGSFYFGEYNGIDEDQSIIMYTELENIVADVTNLPVLPSWYPDGTAIIQVEESSAIGREDICVVFDHQGDFITLELTVYEDIPKQDSEGKKTQSIPEKYYAFGIPHYITENSDANMAVWSNRNIECCIQGDVTVTDLKKMIDSIYQ